MADDDDWGITPDYKNEMTEKEQRYGSKAVPGRIGHIDMDELRKDVVKADEESKKNTLPSASYGYGGKFGVEKDRMDASAVGNDYQSELNKHSSQRDYAKGFGGKYGVETDRQDKAAVGYDHHEELSKHASQKDYSVGFGGKYGVQTDRVDASSVGYKDTNEPPTLHPSQQRAGVTGGENRASELRARFEKLALNMEKPAELPARPDVGKLKPNIFAQPKPTEEPKLEPRPTNVKSRTKEWPPKPEGRKEEEEKPTPAPPPQIQVPKAATFEKPETEIPKAATIEKPKPEVSTLETSELPKPEFPIPIRPPSPESDEFEPPETPTPSSPQPQTTNENVPVSPVPEKEPSKPSTITAVAIYDFQGSQNDELSFMAGDEIEDIDKFDAAWWMGRIGNRVGIFPANRVQENTEGVAAAPASPAVKNIIAMALYDFEGSQSDELSFKAGDEIVDIVKFDTDWWSGRIGDRVGIFPANRVSEN
ncbi:hypothetical protein Aperf_G00000120009 [Anoplocephala perfoliata]